MVHVDKSRPIMEPYLYAIPASYDSPGQMTSFLDRVLDAVQQYSSTTLRCERNFEKRGKTIVVEDGMQYSSTCVVVVVVVAACALFMFCFAIGFARSGGCWSFCKTGWFGCLLSIFLVRIFVLICFVYLELLIIGFFRFLFIVSQFLICCHFGHSHGGRSVPPSKFGLCTLQIPSEK